MAAPRRKTVAPSIRKVLTALAEVGSVEDPSGRTVAKLMPLTGYERLDGLKTALYRLEAQGLIIRHTKSTRTYKIEITEAGRKALSVRPKAGRGAEMPEGPASAWNPPAPEVEQRGQEATPAPVLKLVPPAAPTPAAPVEEIVAETPAGIDYDVLSGVLLKKVAKILNEGDQSTVESMKKLVAQRQADRNAALAEAEAAKKRALEAETKLAEMQDELSEAKGRIFQLDTELRITKQNVETLTKRLQLIDRRQNLNHGEAGALNSVQREIDKMMREKPVAR